MLATIALAYGSAGLACGLAFLASYAAENCLPFYLPTLSPAAAAALVPARPSPVWCERSRRWRDPVTRSFVKAPR